VLCNKRTHMLGPKAVLERVERFFEVQAEKYREAYLARVEDLPESERRTGHRGMFLP
jgi:hypothetical protein